MIARCVGGCFHNPHCFVVNGAVICFLKTSCRDYKEHEFVRLVRMRLQIVSFRCEQLLGVNGKLRQELMLMGEPIPELQERLGQLLQVLIQRYKHQGRKQPGPQRLNQFKDADLKQTEQCCLILVLI